MIIAVFDDWDLAKIVFFYILILRRSFARITQHDVIVQVLSKDFSLILSSIFRVIFDFVVIDRKKRFAFNTIIVYKKYILGIYASRIKFSQSLLRIDVFVSTSIDSHVQSILSVNLVDFGTVKSHKQRLKVVLGSVVILDRIAHKIARRRVRNVLSVISYRLVIRCILIPSRVIQDSMLTQIIFLQILQATALLCVLANQFVNQFLTQSCFIVSIPWIS